MLTILRLTIPAAFLLSACTSTDTPMSTGSGQFAVTNFEEQVVDPTPASGAPEMDAAMSAAAIERYRTGKTKTAATEEASSVPLLNVPAK